MTNQNGSEPILVDEHVHYPADPPCHGCGFGLTVDEKLDKIILFLDQLRPFLPLLARVSAMLDNPAARFRDVAWIRRGQKERTP